MKTPMHQVPIVYEDESEVWLRDIMENHYEEARQRALSLLAETSIDRNGCKVTDTVAPRKVRFRGRKIRAYRFILCVLERAVVDEAMVVRHRCHNRLCMNPDHLQFGTQADNKRDDWERWAKGVDFDLL